MTLLERNDSMLLVIDVQENFYPADRTDVDRSAYADFVERTAWLVAAANALDVPVVVTEEQSEVNGRTEPRVRAELRPAAPVLPKVFFSAPDNPEILRAIHATKRRTIVAVGLETDICVTHSALRLAELGHRVVVAHDCLFSPGACHAEGLDRLRRETGIDVLSAKGVFYDWIRNVDLLDEICAANPALRRTPGFHL